MGPFLRKILKKTALAVIAVILATIAINAADNISNLSESLLGIIILGNKKSPCPKDMVFITSDQGGFCIDLYEASPGEDCPIKVPDNQEGTRFNLDQPSCKPVSVAGAIPWRNISLNQAELACGKAGKRLPTSREWYRAALGTPDQFSQQHKSECNIGKVGVEQPEETGSRMECLSSAGVFDMIGNVWEWVDVIITDGMYNNRKLPQSGFIKSVDTDGMPIETDAEQPDENYNEDYFWVDHQVYMEYSGVVIGETIQWRVCML